MEQLQTAMIFNLMIINVVILVVLAASRHEISYWKKKFEGERESRIDMKRRMDSSVEKLRKQNLLIRAMSLANGFEDPTDQE